MKKAFAIQRTSLLQRRRGRRYGGVFVDLSLVTSAATRGLGIVDGGFRDCVGTGTADFEDLVHFVDEELVFVIGEFAVVVELLEVGGEDSGRGVAEFFEVDDFADEASEDVEETCVFERVLAELLFERLGGEIAQQVIILVGDELKSGFREGGGVIGRDDVASAFAVGLDEGEALLLGQVTAIAGISPVREIHLRNWIGERRVDRGLEFGDDLAGGHAVVEHEVNERAERFGQFGDFAVDVVGLLKFGRY